MQKIYYRKDADTICVPAFTDRYAYDEDYGDLHFLSIGGYTGVVKAILSALVSNRNLRVEIETEEELLTLSSSRWKKLQIVTTKLHGGGSHGMLIAGSKEDEKNILILEATPANIFSFLYERFPITAIPKWQDWIFDTLKKKGVLKKLKGYNLNAALINVTEGELDNLITTGISDKEITF